MPYLCPLDILHHYEIDLGHDFVLASSALLTRLCKSTKKKKY